MSASNCFGVNPQQWSSSQVGFQGNTLSTDIDDLKRDLQKKTREITGLKEEIKQLKEEKESNDARIKCLEGKIKGLETEKNILKEQLDLQVGELNLVKSRVHSLEKEVRSPGLLLIATMCDEIQTLMFKRIFPQRFNPRIPRKVKHIEDMVLRSGDKERKSWDALKAELNWKYQHLDAIRSLKKTRNSYAHPTAKLTEEELRNSAQKMKEERYFDEGEWLSIGVVNELINMWKQLKEKN